MAQQGYFTMANDMQRVVQDSWDCSRTCEQTLRYCLEMSGPHAQAQHITSLLDCADVGQAHASFLLRGSQSYANLALLCADVCDQCAASCDQFGDDTTMRDCAKACRLCSESCLQLSQTQWRDA